MASGNTPTEAIKVTYGLGYYSNRGLKLTYGLGYYANRGQNVNEFFKNVKT